MRPVAHQLALPVWRLAPAGRHILMQAFWRVGLILALLSITWGIGWRLTGNVPVLHEVMDWIGLALWLSAWWLVPALEQLLERQQRHLLGQTGYWLTRIFNTRDLVWNALALATAPLGLLLAYDVLAPLKAAGDLVPEFLTAPQGLYIASCLVAGGSALILFSTGVLFVTRRLAGSTFGVGLWLLISVAAHHSLLLGEELGSIRFAQTGDLTRLEYIPLSLGAYLREVLLFLKIPRALDVYLEYVVSALLAPPMVLLLCSLVLLVFAQAIRPLPSQRLNRGWTTAFTSVAVTAFYSICLGARWANDAARQYPGTWTTLLLLAVASGWLVWWCCTVSGEMSCHQHHSAREYAWLGFAAGCWICLSLPHVLAGQIAQSQLLVGGVLALLLLLAGTLIISRISQLNVLSNRFLIEICMVIALALLLLPSFSENISLPLSLLAEASTALATPECVSYTVAIAVVLALICLAAWPWRWRKLLARTQRHQ